MLYHQNLQLMMSLFSFCQRIQTSEIENISKPGA